MHPYLLMYVLSMQRKVGQPWVVSNYMSTGGAVWGRPGRRSQTWRFGKSREAVVIITCPPGRSILTRGTVTGEEIG